MHPIWLNRPMQPIQPTQPMPYPTALYSLYSAIQCYTVLYSAIQCYTVLYSAIQCYTVLCSAIQCYTVLYSAMQCYTVLCPTLPHLTGTKKPCSVSTGLYRLYSYLNIIASTIIIRNPSAISNMMQ